MKKNTIKKVTKTVKKKKFVPKFIVDFTLCDTITDVYYAMGVAKMFVDIELTETEINAILDTCKTDALYITSELVDSEILIKNSKGFFVEPKIRETVVLKADEEVKIVKKKPNIFKRFWNWITRKK